MLTLTYFFGEWLKNKNIKQTGSKQVESRSTCDPAKQVCKIDYINNFYELQFNGEPSALTPFLVKVNLSAEQPKSIELSFDMVGMDMGYNQYSLAKNEVDWRVKVILPVCSLSRNDWELKVKMFFENEIKVTKFKFSQAEK